MLSIDTLLQQVRQPLSLPDSFHRVSQAIHAPSADAQQIANAISMDQGMAARVLRLANSPLYGFSARIDTVSRALAVIGTRQIMDLAFATTVLKLCSGMLCPGISATDFWTHAFAVGTLARMLASQQREPNVERYFLAGMLSTIGRLTMASAAPDDLSHCLQRHQQEQRLLHDVEREVFGFHQAQVSAELMRRWLLPPMLSTAAAGQYRPPLQGAHAQDCALLHVASVCVTSCGLGCSGETLALPLDPGAWDLLRLQASQIAPLCESVQATAESLCELMEVA